MQTTLTGICLKTEEKRKRGRPIQKHVYDTFFDKIDSAEKAWILGWIVTDGHISKANNSIYIGLKREDKKVLEKISESFPGTRVSDYIVKVKGKEHLCSRIVITSKRIKDRLIELGISSGKKAHKCVVPKEIPEYLMPHFWRGGFEGDGSASINGKGRYPAFTMSGTKSICIEFKNFFNITTKITSGKNRNGKNKIVTSITYTCKKQTNKLEFWQDVYKILYDDYTLENGLFLERKYNKIQEAIAIAKAKSENKRHL